MPHSCSAAGCRVSIGRFTSRTYSTVRRRLFHARITELIPWNWAAAQGKDNHLRIISGKLSNQRAESGGGLALDSSAMLSHVDEVLTAWLSDALSPDSAFNTLQAFVIKQQAYHEYDDIQYGN